MNEIPPFEFQGLGLSMPESDPYANVGRPPAIPKAYESLTPSSAAAINEIALHAKERVSEQNLVAGAKQGMNIDEQDQLAKQRNDLETQAQEIEKKRAALVNAQSDVAGHQELQDALSQVMAGRPIKSVPKVIANPNVWQSIAGALGGILDPKRASEYAQIPSQVARAQQNDANTQQALADQVAQEAYQARLDQAAQNYDRFARMDQFRVKEANDAVDKQRDSYDRQSGGILRAIQGIDNAELRRYLTGQNNDTKKQIAGMNIAAKKELQSAAGLTALAKMTPQGRYKRALELTGSEEAAQAYGSMSPAELLSQARASKIPEEINKLKAEVRRTNSGIKLDQARAGQIIEATRFIGKSFDLKRQQLALNVENVHNLMRVRKAGIALRKDQIEKGASAMNQARRSTTYLQSLAQKEYGKLLDAGNLTDEQEARKLELEAAIDQNQAIIDGLNEAQGLVPELDPSQVNQMFGGIMGLTGKSNGTLPPAGQNYNDGGFDPSVRPNIPAPARSNRPGNSAVAPANANVRVTAIRRGKGNK